MTKLDDESREWKLGSAESQFVTHGPTKFGILLHVF